MNIYLYNTESRQKERIEPIDGRTVRMYTCGPTIYDFAHIGNFRTYVFEDLLRRTLKWFGFGVEQAMNITDIDDKTIRGAIAKNIPLKEFTEPFRIAFFEDLKSLHIEPVEHYPAATDYIPQMVRIIEKLLEKGCAYRSEDGSVYFSIRHFPSYGRLSHLQMCDLKSRAAVETDEYDKENVSDFALWKAHDPERDGPIFWESSLGPGRPGWHIECSAMAMSLLGESIDIHCGGVDNMFPHHENEIAQSECYSGHVFARHWLHAEHLLVDHKKMSKSAGNFYTLRDLSHRGYSGLEVRYLLLAGHYRTQLNFTFAGLDGARTTLARVRDLVQRLRAIEQDGAGSCTEVMVQAEVRFKEALADDLNISAALAALFELARELNILADRGKVTRSDAERALALLADWDKVLAVLPLHREEMAPAHVEALLRDREEARQRREWAKSDQLRDQILSFGYVIEDTQLGARLKKRRL